MTDAQITNPPASISHARTQAHGILENLVAAEELHEKGRTALAVSVANTAVTQALVLTKLLREVKSEVGGGAEFAAEEG